MTHVGLIPSRERKSVIDYDQSENSIIDIIVSYIGFVSGYITVQYRASGGTDCTGGLRRYHTNQQRDPTYVHRDVCSSFTNFRTHVDPHLDSDLHPFASADLYAKAHAYVNPDDYALSAAAATSNCNPGAPGRGNGNYDDRSVFWISSYTYTDACAALSYS